MDAQDVICGHPIKSGINRNQLCTRKWRPGHEACTYHIPILGKRLLKQQRPPPVLTVGPRPIPTQAPFYSVDTFFRANQVAAGHAVLAVYRQEPRMPCCVLVAQCQSGKTGAARHVIQNFCNAHLDAVVFLLIPISSNEILSQARREFAREVQPDNILSLPQMLQTDCLRIRLARYPGRQCLIVVDESHMNALVDQSANCLYNTLRNAGIHPNGLVIPDNCWLLSISATPNAELSGLLQESAVGKKAVVYLEPGVGYYGLKDMVDLGRIHPALKLTTPEGQTAFLALLQTQYAHRLKYAIVRMNSHACCEEFARRLVAAGLQAMIFDSFVQRTRQIAAQVDIAPMAFTVLLIVHRLRASIQLNTQHICLVHENNIKNVDTTTQGLPGRMCGYGKRDDAVDVYCNPEAVHQQVAWQEDRFGVKTIPPCRSITGHYVAPNPVDAPPRYAAPIIKSIYHCGHTLAEPPMEELIN